MQFFLKRTFGRFRVPGSRSEIHDPKCVITPRNQRFHRKALHGPECRVDVGGASLAGGVAGLEADRRPGPAGTERGVPPATRTGQQGLTRLSSRSMQLAK